MLIIEIPFVRRIAAGYRKAYSVLLLSLALMPLSYPLFSQQFIADSSVAKEEVLRKIPQEFINKARTELVIAYQHTSHGTHVSRGVFGLQDYKMGDTLLFGVSFSPSPDKLEFRDYALQSYAPSGVDGSDLSRNETAFIQTTRNYLDAPENASVNVVMWSWCNIADHDAAGNYLPGMDSLISEYGLGGTKIGTGEGQREVSVTFIRMTGHANVNANTGSLNPKEQADTIIGYSNTHQQYCLDYYSIDTHDMDDNYWEDAGDDGNSSSYGGNFYIDWQDSHTLGDDYFENKETPGGSVTFGAHNTQHITANRKAYAMWWILARIAGWNGDTAAIVPVTSIEIISSGGVVEIETGDTLRFSAEVLPVEATNQEVTWSISNGSGSASISEEGLLTAIDTGSVTIVATAQDSSGVTGSFPLTIILPEVLVTGVTIASAGGVSALESGTELQFSVTVSPGDASNQEVDWSVAEETGTASITAQGLLTAGIPGTVTVVATAKDGSAVSDTFYLTITTPEIPVSGITVSSVGGVTTLESGSTLQFSVTILPVDASNKEVEWNVIDGVGTATITLGGLLTAGNPGSVAVIASAKDGSAVSDTFYLTITTPEIPVSGITVSSVGGVTTLESGSTLQFSVTILPVDASNKEIDWSILNGTGTASITGTGLLTAGNPGMVTVVATAKDGSGVTDNFILTITAPVVTVTSITVSSNGDVTELESGAKLQFSATVLPAGATNTEVVWSVAEETGTASITVQGLLTAGNPGNLSVVATAQDGSGVTGTFDLAIATPIIKVSDIKIASAGDISVVEEGEMLQFTATVSPSDAINPAVFWGVTSTTKGAGLGTITDDGMFIALAEGVVDVVAVAQDGSGVFDLFTLTLLGPSVIGKNESETVILYPNPGKGLFFLNARDLKVELVQVVDVNGGVVLELIPEPGNRVIELDLSRQQSGLYFIKVFSGDRFMVKRAIITR